MRFVQFFIFLYCVSGVFCTTSLADLEFCEEVLYDLGLLVDDELSRTIPSEISDPDGLEAALYCIDIYESDTNKVGPTEPPRTECRAPPIVKNGKMVTTKKNSYKLYEQAIYECDEGYMLSQQIEYAICVQINGGSPQWMEPLPLCTKPCPDVPRQIPNGRVTSLNPAGGYSHYDEVDYVCDEEYTTSDGLKKVKLVCLGSGNWDRKVPTYCSRGNDIMCSAPPKISNGEPLTGRVYVFSVGFKVNYNCDSGFKLDSSKGMASECLGTGKWSTAPRCVPDSIDPNVKCSSPPFVKFAFASPSELSNDIGTEAKYDCVPGYQLLSSIQTITCLPDGEWSTPTPECYSVGIECKEVQKIPGATDNVERGKRYIPGNEILYTCISNGDVGRAQCDTEGSWRIVEMPTCTSNTCPTPPRFPGAVPKDNADSHPVDSLVTYRCDGGETVKVGSVYCEPNGEWKILTRPVCRSQKNCGEPPVVKGAIPVGTKTQYKPGDSVPYICSNGKTLPDSQAVCQDDGEWRASILSKCGGCGQPESLPGMERSHMLDDHTLNDLVTYSCIGKRTVKQGVTICQETGLWSKPVPAICEYGGCTNPDTILNGETIQPLQDEYEEADVVVFMCVSGYEMEGDPAIECKEGSWTTKPKCVLEEDPGCYPVNVEDGEVIAIKPNYKLGEELNYRCDSGFKASGEPVCQKRGKWSESPKCVIDPVCSPVLVENGGIVDPKPTYEIADEFQYRCNTGFEKNGRPFCMGGGKWSEEPNCVEMPSCRPVPINNGGVVDVQSKYEMGDELRYKCDTGYTNKGRPYCVENGQWTETPTCVKEQGCQPIIVDNGGLVDVKSVYEIGDELMYRCDSDYTKKGEPICLGSEWSEIPRCEMNPIKGCTPVSIRKGAIVDIMPLYEIGKTLSYRCDNGYTDKTSPICKSDGMWSVAPLCELADVCLPVDVKNGDAEDIQSSYNVEEEFRYRCQSGFSPEGKPMCLPGGKWSEEPECIPDDVCQVVKIKDGEVLNFQQTYNVGQYLRYTCDSGFIKGKETICQDGGRWSATPECIKETRCDTPSRIRYGSYSVPTRNYVVGTVAVYTCSDGYVMSGSATVTCQANGRWTSLPSCSAPKTVYCQEPSYRITNGRRYYRSSKGSHKPGSRVRYVCYNGYKMSGSAYITCESDGGWSTFPKCAREISSGQRYCRNSPSYISNAESHKRPSYMKVGSTYEYECKKGYSFQDDISSVECLTTGKWSQPTPRCVRHASCPRPPKISHGYFKLPSKYSDGSKAKYYCYKGYDISNKYAYCTNGKWTSVPKCVLEPPSGSSGGSGSGS